METLIKLSVIMVESVIKALRMKMFVIHFQMQLHPLNVNLKIKQRIIGVM
jgi:hypothetical protein